MTTDFLNTEHCLAIAGAFIAIIGACATLVNIANSKSDALVNRYRDVTKEYRAERTARRRNQLREQIDLYAKRAEQVYRAQQCLFAAMGFFILSIAVFVGIGLYFAYIMTPGDKFYSIAQPFLLGLIGAFVSFGTALMVKAIYFYFRELRYAKATFDSETSDCRGDKISLRLQKLREGYSILRPGLPGCWFQGETEEEAIKNIQDVFRAYVELEDELLRGEVQRV